MGAGEPVASLAELQTTAQHNPHDARAWIDLAEALVDHGDLERAPLALRHAHALSAESPPRLVEVSHLYRRLDNRVEANNAARRALHLDPGLESAALAVARLLLDAGDPHAAVLSLRVAAHRHPDSKAVHLALAQAYLEAERGQEALRHALRAERIAPDDPATLRVLGRTYAALGDAEGELDTLDRLVDAHEEDVEAAIRLGEVLAQQDRTSEAAATLTRIAEHPPSDAALLVRLAAALTDAQVLVLAVRCAREAIRTNPDLAQAHFQLGRALGIGGALEESIGSLRTAADLAPEDGEVGFALGRALREAGKPREAAGALIRAAAAAPHDARIQDELADTLAALKTPSQDQPAPRLPSPAVIPQAPLPSENTEGGFTGDLAVFSLAELVEFLATQHATGDLTVRRGDETGTIRLHAGAITAIGYPGGKNLAELLVDGELITRTDLKRSVVRPEDLDKDSVVAQVVVERNLVDRASVQGFLRQRVLEGMQELITWKSGSVLFRRKPPPREPPTVEVDSRSAILEAMRRIEEG